MNIRHRITLLVVLTFFAISLIGGFAVYQSRSSTLDVRSVTQGVVPSALASVEMVSQLKDVQLSVMAIMSATDMNIAQQASERVLATQARLQRAFDEQMAQATTDAERGLVKQATKTWRITLEPSGIRWTSNSKVKMRWRRPTWRPMWTAT